MKRRFNLPARATGSGALILFAAAILLAQADGVHAQKRRRANGTQAARVTTTSAPPRFDDYPVKEVYKGRVAPVVLDNRRARMFRSKLREDSRAGVNFAGHYTVVFWGCGTGCAQMAVIDAKSGRVYWPPLDYIDVPGAPEDAATPHPNFRPDSKLLVLTRARYDGRSSYTAYYYLFDKNRFRLLRRAEERHPDPENSTQQ